MSQDIIKAVEQAQLKADVPQIKVGDTVDVHFRIVEGEKERIQVFQGVVLAMKGTGLNRMVTVRRIVANEGVERIFPLHSPKVAKIEVKRSAHVRRAKLFYLRERVGRKRRLRDQRRGLETNVSVPSGASVGEVPVAAAPSGEAAPKKTKTKKTKAKA